VAHTGSSKTAGAPQKRGLIAKAAGADGVPEQDFADWKQAAWLLVQVAVGAVD
jgi:hypothetical protein